MLRQLRLRLRAGMIIVAICAGIVIAGSAAAEASTVRGRLYRATPQGYLPAVGIPVTVYRPDLGRSGASTSGADGMYYLFNIPPGYYTLEIWTYPNSPPMTFGIQVQNTPFTDINPIQVP